MDHGLLDILACPSCKSQLVYKPGAQVLICRADRLAFPIRNGKPIMLLDQADALSTDQLNELIASSP